MKNLKENLKTLRRKFAVTQEELALQVNKNKTTIGNWETGLAEPSIDNLLILAQYYGVSVDFLLMDDIEKSSLITAEHILKMKSKQKGKAVPVGKKYKIYGEEDSPESLVSEAQELSNWAVLKAVKELSGKVDQLRVDINK